MLATAPTLTPSNHDRDTSGMTYVYPVVSRRAGGVSVGINLNPNNACNWRCLYCQVPDLRRGAPPPIDLALLETELRTLLDAIVRGDFMHRHVHEDMRRLNDIALSGNGEPTSAPEFPQVVTLIERVMADFGLPGKIRLVLITNGSLVHKTAVRQGIAHMRTCGGEVWFKFDRATQAGFMQVNDTHTRPEAHYQRLRQTAALCPTWIQTCMFAFDGAPPAEAERTAYLAMLARARNEKLPVCGVLLYGLARQPRQADSARLGALPVAWMEALAEDIRALGWTVQLTP